MKYGYHLIIRLKAIKSIKEFLYSLSSHINLQSSNLFSPKPSYWHDNYRKIWFDYMFVMDRMRFSHHRLTYRNLLLFSQIWFWNIWLVPKIIYSWITRLVLLFIWAQIQSWLLDHLATSLDWSTLLGLGTIGRDCPLIENE